jgi:hypothetical protein
MPGWFACSEPLLVQYVRHCHYADELAAMIAALRQGELDRNGRKELLVLMRAYGNQTEIASRLAVKLKLAPRSRYRNDYAGANSRTPSSAPAPWLDWGSDREQ